MLLVDLEDVLDPLDVDNLQLLCLRNWTWNCWAFRIEIFEVGVNWSEIFPWKAWLGRVLTFCWIDRNGLASLGR